MKYFTTLLGFCLLAILVDFSSGCGSRPSDSDTPTITVDTEFSSIVADGSDGGDTDDSGGDVAGSDLRYYTVMPPESGKPTTEGLR
ncbi:UNVERIFIED_CONTAM: hypothetical protein PYX00_002197 [Menopon gallinae]|uniref:Secreted protein n=1 Tax=Menopon gallinae TaxID=328185 RepID=A0AAW2IGB0_9NEOP